MRLVVVGARGQLGAAVVHVCTGRHEVIALDRARLDLTDAAAVRSVIGGLGPDAVINCAAYNTVDRAETEAADAIRINALIVRNLARAVGDATLVHYSTDFVFDGRSDRPYVETDAPNPQSTYGMSKLLGEWFAGDASRAFVLRVESLFGHAPGALSKGSVASIVEALRAGRAPRVFEDRTVSPTYVADAAEATLGLLERRAAPGVYHCVNSGHCTWLELAQEAARLLDLPARFDTVRFADVKLPAARPQYCALSNAKLAAAGIAMPSWQDALSASLRGRTAAPRD